MNGWTQKRLFYIAPENRPAENTKNETFARLPVASNFQVLYLAVTLVSGSPKGLTND